jgi:uncharacterized protein with von Willebrand factor type A (vWA) domain
MLAFRAWSEKLTDVAELFNGTTALAVPSRADQRYALCSAVAWHLWRHPDRQRALHVLFDVGHKLPSDFAAMLMVDALNNRSPDEISSVIKHPRFGHWTQQHGAAFANRYKAHASRLTREQLQTDDPHVVSL